MHATVIDVLWKESCRFYNDLFNLRWFVHAPSCNSVCAFCECSIAVFNAINILRLKVIGKGISSPGHWSLNRAWEFKYILAWINFNCRYFIPCHSSKHWSLQLPHTARNNGIAMGKSSCESQYFDSLLRNDVSARYSSTNGKPFTKIVWNESTLLGTVVIWPFYSVDQR